MLPYMKVRAYQGPTTDLRFNRAEAYICLEKRYPSKMNPWLSCIKRDFIQYDDVDAYFSMLDVTACMLCLVS